MGRAWVSGSLQRDDFQLLEKPGASLEADRRANHRCCLDLHGVCCRTASGGTLARCSGIAGHALLALLAALVSASIFSFLLRGTRLSGPSCQSKLAGRATHGLRSLTLRRSTIVMAGAIRNAVA